MSRLGENIYKARTDSGMSITLVSDFAQIDRKTLRRAETSGDITVNNLIRIARVLGVRPSDLLEGVE